MRLISAKEFIEDDQYYPIDPNMLPDTWEMEFIGFISNEIQTGFACGKHSDSNIGVPHLRPMNIDRKGNLDFETLKYVPTDFNSRRLKSGDVLFNNTNSPELIGKTAYIDNRANEFAFSNHMTSVSFSSYINPKFAALQIHYLWMSRFFLHHCVKHVNQASFSSTDFSKLTPFITPPINEQHRIVSKIEELFSELDAGIASLKKAQAQLKVYRQAVLKAAFEGELTMQWRQEHAAELESAEVLLEQIEIERAKQSQAALEQWKADVKAWEAEGKLGKKPAKPRQKEVDALGMWELSDLPELPDGWAWSKIGNLSQVQTGATPLKKNASYYTNGSIPWVTSGALNELYIREASDYVTELAMKETNLKIFPKNTLLVAMYGEGKTRGKCSELLIDATTNQAIAALVQNGLEEKLRPFIKYFMLKNYDEIRIKASGGAQPNLNLSIIENIVLPICSLQEQNQIVSEIESRLSLCDKLEETLAENLKKTDFLRQSILKKAFEGKLVPQDPSDEPASVLLERIQAEKAAYQTEAKKIKKPRKVKSVSQKPKPILELLKSAKAPIPTRELWKNSIHANNIDAFYAELKRLEKSDQLLETKTATESLLSLKA